MSLFTQSHETMMLIDVEAALIHIITWLKPRVANPWCQGHFVMPSYMNWNHSLMFINVNVSLFPPMKWFGTIPVGVLHAGNSKVILFQSCNLAPFHLIFIDVKIVFLHKTPWPIMMFIEVKKFYVQSNHMIWECWFLSNTTPR